MGRSTYAVPVPHKVESIAYYDGRGHNVPSGWELALTGLEGHGLPTIPNKMGPGGTHDPNYVDGVDLGNGWQYIQSCIDYTRHNNTLYCDEVIHETKGYTIYVVNESPWAAGGEYNMCLFADTRKPLEDFLADMNVTDAPILDVAAVQQTL